MKRQSRTSAVNANIDSMPLDPRTLDDQTPRTLDGRSYPEELRPYENRDAEILPLALALDSSGPFLVDELAELIDRPRTRASLPRWIASAGWRGLIFKDGSIGNSRLWSLDRDRCLRRLTEIEGAD
jgi:hypothetical protein